MKMKVTIVVIVIFGIVSFYLSLRSVDFINSGSCEYKKVQYFFGFKVYEKVSKNKLSEYIKLHKLNGESKWLNYFHSSSFLEDIIFRTTHRGTFKGEYYYIDASIKSINNWLIYYEDLNDPNNLNYKLVQSLMIDYMKLLKEPDEKLINKFTLELRNH